ncbi:Uncharacterised protein [Chromobacterium violaceum]|uniref:Uncharacterized protein n=1 Tax=Chromobacterium violaceum TaxID=536 RepID=A0A3S4IXB8_CHRVL|nr:Uncharacterised protein [Chromobacterium violaceum]
MQAGQLVDLTVSRYLNKPVDFAEGSPLGSYQLPTDPRHFAFAVDVVQALGIRDGCLHLEFFETADKRLVFLEVANRMGAPAWSTRIGAMAASICPATKSPSA